MNFKIRVRDAKQSEEIQKILFELGYSWGTSQDQRIRNTKTPFLYLYGEDKKIKFGKVEENFIGSSAEEIEL